MKNNYFTKATALGMGLLVISANPALSFSTNARQLSNGNTLGNSQFTVAQENISVSVAIAVAVKVLDRSVVIAQTVVRRNPVRVPPEYRDIVLPKLLQAQQSMARAQSSAQKGNNAETASAIAVAIGFMGDAQASARADAGSVQAISQAIANANQALAVAQGKT